MLSTATCVLILLVKLKQISDSNKQIINPILNKSAILYKYGYIRSGMLCDSNHSVDELNRIADQRDGNNLPEGISQETVADYCKQIHNEMDELIATCVAETPLTYREAAVWALRNSYAPGGVFLTEDAVALVLSATGSPFTDPDNIEVDSSFNTNITAADVEEFHEQAENKYNKAVELVGLSTFRDRSEHLISPKIAWLDSHTIRKLQDRGEPEDETIDDVVTRLLYQTETRRSLEDVVRGYLDERGVDNVAQLAVTEQSLETGVLELIAHTTCQDEVPDVIKEIDIITIKDQRYRLHFVEDNWGSQDLGRITLYAADNIHGMDLVQLDRGLEAAYERIEEIPDRPFQP